MGVSQRPGAGDDARGAHALSDGRRAVTIGSLRVRFQAVPHYLSDELDGEWALAQARSAFDGPLDIAREGAVYDV